MIHHHISLEMEMKWIILLRYIMDEPLFRIDIPTLLYREILCSLFSLLDATI